MDIVNRLKSKKVQVREIPGWGPYVRQQWEDSFAEHLIKRRKRFFSIITDFPMVIYGIYFVMKKEIV